MRPVGAAFQLSLAVGAVVLGGGCISQQQSEFRGSITRGLAATNTPSVQPSGEQIQVLDPAFSDALTGFGVPQGDIFFIHDRLKYVDSDYRLANGAVSAVYFYERETPTNATAFPGSNPAAGQAGGMHRLQNLFKDRLDEKAFLARNAAARDRFDGMHRLQGSFDVERWKSNIDFRIRLAMRSAEPNPVVVDGILTTHSRWEFNPLKAMVVIFASMGLGGE